MARTAGTRSYTYQRGSDEAQAGWARKAAERFRYLFPIHNIVPKVIREYLELNKAYRIWNEENILTSLNNAYFRNLRKKAGRPCEVGQSFAERASLTSVGVGVVASITGGRG